jgi:hypothetical protein
VEKRRNGEIFVATVLKDGRRDRKQMSNIRSGGSFPHLPSMNMRRVQKSAIKSIGQNGRKDIRFMLHEQSADMMHH